MGMGRAADQHGVDVRIMNQFPGVGSPSLNAELLCFRFHCRIHKRIADPQDAGVFNACLDTPGMNLADPAEADNSNFQHLSFLL